MLPSLDPTYPSDRSGTILGGEFFNRLLGYEPSLEPPCEGKVLDARCEVDGVQVFFEVRAPRFSDAFHDASKAVQDLKNALQAAVSDCRLEVEIFEPLTRESQEAIVAAARTADDGVWVAVEGAARIRKIATGSPLPPNFDGDGTQVRMAGDTNVKGPGMSLVIRWENNDDRAKRLFNAEYEHFSKRVANVLVMNAAPAGGLRRWTQPIQRLLQPGRNRKVGAVALFDGGMLGPPEAIRRRWHVIVNLHAHHAIPARLVDDLRSLDESRYFGLEPTPKGT